VVKCFVRGPLPTTSVIYQGWTEHLQRDRPN